MRDNLNNKLNDNNININELEENDIIVENFETKLNPLQLNDLKEKLLKVMFYWLMIKKIITIRVLLKIMMQLIFTTN